MAYAGGFIGPLAGNTIFALVGHLKDAFNATVGMVYLSITVYMIPFVIFQLFSGTISDYLGRKVVATSGFLVYSVGSVLCGWATDLNVFLGGRLIQGLGFAFVTPVLHAIVGDYAREDKRGISMGIFGGVTAASVSTGPVLAGALSFIDWRLTFYLIAGLAFAVFLAIQMAFRGARAEKIPKRRREEVSVFEIATDRRVIALCLAGFLAFFSFIGVVSYTSDTLEESPYHYDGLTIGLVLFSGGAGGVFISPLAGYLVDRIGRLRTGIIGFFGTSVGMPIFIFSTDLWHFILAMVVVGCAAAAIWASLLTLTVELVPERKGAVASLFNSSRFSGYALSPVLFAGIYFSMGVRPIYVAGILLAFVGVAIMLVMKRLLARRI
ncbi:MAG: MFS transporter [Thermoplasmata archaeon]